MFDRLRHFIFAPMSRRKALGSAALALGGLGGAAGRAFLEPSMLSTTRRDIFLRDLPEALDGLRIAQITDLHYRPEEDRDLMTQLLAAIAEENPDLIAMTGDYLNDDLQTLAPTFAELSALTAREGVFVSPGNHDRWVCGNILLRKTASQHGFDYLSNQGSMRTIRGEHVFLNELDSIWAGTPDPQAAWKGHDGKAPVISLVHEPDQFDSLVGGRRMDLQLSGHTHGGQCRVPLVNYAPIKVKYGRNYLYGHYQKKDSHLWVGRGLGTTGMRVRFACRPELAILTLKSAPT